MSSHQYGFTCSVPWEGRSYLVQIVYKGTWESEPHTLDEATHAWESQEPTDLARHELTHRTDWTNPHDEVRISVWQVWGGWIEGDPRDPAWDPPQPNERQVLEVIAAGLAVDYDHGWDT